MKDVEFNPKPDHVHGNFEWEKEPSCCENLLQALEEKFVFVSNFTDGGMNQIYMMPLISGGYLAKSDGIPIHHCPWCGEKLKVRKKYPLDS